MHKKTLALIGTLSVVLTGCSTLGHMSMQHGKLATGKPITFGTNLTPTNDWHCKFIKRSPYYNWSQIQQQAQQIRLLPKDPSQFLMAKLIKEANKTKIKANYANMIIPETSSTSVGVGDMSVTSNDYTGAKAHGMFYQCQQINPEGTIGYRAEQDTGLNFG